MKNVYCGAVLLLSIFVAIFALRNDENGNTKFDSDWLWMGSSLSSLGKFHSYSATFQSFKTHCRLICSISGSF